MKIEAHGLYVSQNRLGSFARMFGGPGFFPFVKANKFIFSGTPDFSLEHLTMILPEKKFTGTVTESSFEEIQKIVDYNFSWQIDAHGVLSQTTNQALIKARTFIFFDVIQTEFLDNTITHYYLYHPKVDDYFADSTLWSFCFILLTDSYGIVFYGKSWPSPTACKPDSLDE